MKRESFSLGDLEARVGAGDPLGRADAERVLATADLISIGMLGEAARRHRAGARVTFGRVCHIVGPELPDTLGDAGEVRVRAVPASIDEARERVRQAATFAGAVPLTGFSLTDLLALVNHDHLALAECARSLAADGLHGIAEAPIDELGDADTIAELVRAVRHGGLTVSRLTVDRAPQDRRLALVLCAADVQRQVGGIKAFAPLPRIDAVDTPSTGYDDVRMVTIASATCADIPFIQVDWQIYGPKLAQVAIGYGANDLDAVANVDTLLLGARRSPAEEIARQIRAAGATPAERNGRYEIV